MMTSIFRVLLILIIGLVSSTHAFAAKFQNVPKLKSLPAQRLAEVVAKLNKNKSAFGDAGKVVTVSFVRHAEEQDINTIKQLNHARGRLNLDDIGAIDFDERSTAELVEHLMEYLGVNDGDNEREYAEARKNLTSAIRVIKRSSNLKIYGTSHSDEDGTWQILDVLDVTNGQALFVSMGYRGN